MLQLGVIEEVPDNVPTVWCTNPVITPKKNGNIRLCSNMRATNAAILRPNTESMTVEDAKVKMNSATYFLVMDMNKHKLYLSAYQVPTERAILRGDRSAGGKADG